MTRILLSLVFALLLSSTASAAPAPAAAVEGEDYQLIDGGQPYLPLQGKIEVVEVFAYSCPHCAEFEPRLDAWRRKQARDVRVAFVPWTEAEGNPLSRAYFTTQALGAAERTHPALFRAMHDDNTMPLNPSDAELQQWLVGQGLPAASVRAAWTSPAVSANLRRAADFARASGIESTPTLIVNGKYRILGKSRDDQLRILDALIASLRRQRR